MPRLRSIVRHRITLLLAAIVVLIGALHLASPALVRIYALHWFKDHGATHARIARVRINPWLGRLTVEGLTAGKGLSVGQAAIDIDWWPLWHHRIDLRALHLTQARLDLVQGKDGSWAPAGLRLPPSAAPSSGHPWRLTLHGVHLSQVRIMLAGKALSADIPIEHLALTLASMSASGAQVLNADLRLGQGSMALGDYRAGDSALLLHGQLMIPADAFTPGARHLAMQAQGLHLEAGKAAVSLKRVQARDITAQASGNIQAGGIALQGLTAAALPHGIGIHIDTADAGPVRLQSGTLTAARLQLTGMRATAPGLSLGGAQSATLTDLSLGTGMHATLSRLALHGIELPATPDHSLGRIDGITATGTDIDGGLSLHRLNVQGMDVALLHRKGGLAVIDRLKTMAGGPAAPAPKASGAKAPGVGSLPPVRIGSIGIDDTSRISLHDAAIEPPFVTHLRVESFRLDAFDTEGNTPSTVATALRLGNEGKLTLKGNFRLHGSLKAADMNLVVRRFSMPPLSGYTERDFGNAINTGQMDLDSRVRVHDDEIQAQNKITVRNLALKSAPQAGKATQALGMPLGMAVDMLRNDRGDITLDVPVNGRLGDPNVHLSDAFDQALASAMRSAALSSATLLLQPYGSILPALSMAAGLIGQVSKPRLTPIAFEPRTAALSKQARAYITRITALMEKKKDFRLQVCGVAARADFLAGAAPAKGSSAYNSLLTLATARSSQIIKALVAAGVSPDRLFSCRPVIDRHGAEGRVELLLD